MKYFQSSSYHAQKSAFPPGTSVFLALHGNEVVSVTPESVNLDQQMRQNIPCYLIFICLAVWLCLKMGFENTVLERLLQIGAMDLTVTSAEPFAFPATALLDELTSFLQRGSF